MAGVTEKPARELIREADAAPDGDGPGSPPPAAGAPDPRSQVVVQSQSTEQGAARGDGGRWRELSVRLNEGHGRCWTRASGLAGYG
jgi:hypothetical protein